MSWKGEVWGEVPRFAIADAGAETLPLQALFDRYLGRVKVQGCAVISRLRFEDLDPQVQGLIVPLHVSDEVVAQFVLVSVAEYLSAQFL